MTNNHLLYLIFIVIQFRDMLANLLLFCTHIPGFDATEFTNHLLTLVMSVEVMEFYDTLITVSIPSTVYKATSTIIYFDNNFARCTDINFRWCLHFSSDGVYTLIRSTMVNWIPK